MCTILDGQAGRRQLDDGGYLLVALLIGIAVASIWMAAALPAWRQQAQREKEAELIFRGEQYARAIVAYQQKMNGALPSSFDDLISQHTLRHKWKDPITGDEFLPKVGCGQPVTGNGVGDPPAPNINPSNPRGNPTGPRGTGPTGPTGPNSQPPIGQRGGSPGQPGFGAPQVPNIGRIGQPGVGGQGGLCGVQSKSKAQSIRTYNGQQEYDMWEFDTLTANALFQKSVAKLGGAVPGQGIGLPVGSPGRGIRGGPGVSGPFNPTAPRTGMPGPNGPIGAPPNRGIPQQPFTPGMPIGSGR